MMKRMKFGKNTEKYCKYCIHGKFLEYTDEVFCVKKGFVDKFHKCLKYKYDPLKRVPKNNISKREFTKEDFQL